LFFGERFAKSARLLVILVPGLSFLTVFYLVCSALNGIGRVRTSMYLAVVGAFANTALNIVAIRAYGLVGAAWATSLGATLTTLVSLVVLQRIIPVSVNLKNTAKTIFVGVMLFFAAILLPTTDWQFIPFSIILGSGYLALLVSFGVVSKSDLSKNEEKLD
jgi:O-antigen/teichoic acid export membrane protein